MEYNYKKIGIRIKQERKRKKWSQDRLIDELENHGIYIGRNSLSNIENGKVDVTQSNFRLIPVLCQLFGCDAGYLLCEYDERSWELSDVSKYIGLSEAAVNDIKSQPFPVQYFYDHWPYDEFFAAVHG